MNPQNSSNLTRWLENVSHFHVFVQQFAGSNLNYTDPLSRYTVEKATTENYEDELAIKFIVSQLSSKLQNEIIRKNETDQLQLNKVLNKKNPKLNCLNWSGESKTQLYKADELKSRKKPNWDEGKKLAVTSKLAHRTPLQHIIKNV